jgi:rhamnogalacturonyl hydrolase YesR
VGGTTTTGGVATSGGTSTVGGTIKTGGSTPAGGSSGGTTSSGGAASTGGGITITGLPARSAVLASMRSANDWFMNKHPDPSAAIVTDKSRPSNLWTRAAYHEGLNALYNVETDETKKTSYYTYAVKWGDSHSWAMANVTAPATTSDNPDNEACGQSYIDIYNIGVARGDTQATRLTAITASIKGVISSGVTSSNKWWWIDAIHMSMPSYAKLGVLNNDTSYFDGMWVMYNDARTKEGGGLWNATDGLWFRDLHYTPSGGTATPMTAAINNAIPASTTDAYYVAPNGKGLYWSRGDGWVTAALVRVLDILPTTDSHRATYVADFQAQMKALIAIQRTDGFWNESLMDPTHCATIGMTGDDGPETSGTDFFTYGLAWGIRKGLLDSATYGSPLQKAWNGLSTVALQSSGLLGYTQSTGDRPCTEDTQNPGSLSATRLANFDDYGVGGFLLAGSEVYQLTNN